MKITIEGTPKEIAALVLAVQERREEEIVTKIETGMDINLITDQLSKKANEELQKRVTSII